MSRLEKFESFNDHRWLGKFYKMLSPDELAFCHSFIQQNDHLEKAEFETQVRNLYMDQEKPKNGIFIVDLLSTCNT